MRLPVFLSLAVLSSILYAAELPSDVQPLPPPPALDGNEPAEEPQVVITKESGQTIEELRIGGQLYAIKITPKHGKPYYLVDSLGDGKFARQESLDSGVRVPRWVLKKF